MKTTIKNKIGALFLFLSLSLVGGYIAFGSGISGGGGGGIPGGSTTQFQYNNGGVFGGAAQLNWNSTDNEAWGETFNNQHVKIMAGMMLTHLTSPRVLTGWISPYTTEIDLSGLGHNGTYGAGWGGAGRVQKGFAWYLNVANSSTKNVVYGDHADYTFGTGLADSPFSIGAWINVVDSGGDQIIWGKWNNFAAQSEYSIYLDNAERFILNLQDQSVPATPRRQTNGALNAGWNFVVATYDGAGGGAAMNNVVLYVNGLVAASTAVNDAAYVAMENLGANLRMGSADNGGNPWQSFVGVVFLEGSQLSAASVYRLYAKTRGFYNR